MGQDKASLPLGRKTMLEIVLGRIPQNCPIVVVGDAPPVGTRSVTVTREEPVLGGPVAAIAAGIRLVETSKVAVVAVDMPHAPRTVVSIADTLTQDEDCVVPVDEDGRRQPLAAVYWVESLRRALLGVDVHGGSMRALLTELSVREVPLGSDLLIDLDTPEDVQNFMREADGGSRS